MSIMKLDWGDSVIITANAPTRYKINTKGSICGFRVVESETVAEKFGVPIGTLMCLVEGRDGVAVEIPEIYLDLS